MAFTYYPLLKKERKLGAIKTARAIFAISLILSAPLTLLIAIAKLGEEIGIVESLEYNALILTAIIGGLLGPIGFSLIYPPELRKKG